jgi:hypothetical protein
MIKIVELGRASQKTQGTDFEVTELGVEPCNPFTDPCDS